MSTPPPEQRSTVSDLTVYGATSFTAQHVLMYLLQTGVHLAHNMNLTLAGRNASKLQALQNTLESKMAALQLIQSGQSNATNAASRWHMDVFVADSTHRTQLNAMAVRTKVVLNCAGPFAQYSTHVVAACVNANTHYVDITGEVSWVGHLRRTVGPHNVHNTCRIVSLCGFDSVPSDLAVYAAVTALRQSLSKKNGDIQIAAATTWHHILGGINGGTLQTMADMPLRLQHTLLRTTPFVLDDPLVLIDPRQQGHDYMEHVRRCWARHEWYNQCLHVESICNLGVSVPFIMAAVNAKVVHASALALQYNDNDPASFTYRERGLPVGFQLTRSLSLISLLVAVVYQVAVIILLVLVRTPVLGPWLRQTLFPPGTGPSERTCQNGITELYAHVRTHATTTKNARSAGHVDKATCWIKFTGDPGNYVTAQCVCEAAYSLLLTPLADLPARSRDGFGTPAQLLGPILLQRLRDTKVRPIEFQTMVRHNVPAWDWQMYP